MGNQRVTKGNLSKNGRKRIGLNFFPQGQGNCTKVGVLLGEKVYWPSAQGKSMVLEGVPKDSISGGADQHAPRLEPSRQNLSAKDPEAEVIKHMLSRSGEIILCRHRTFRGKSQSNSYYMSRTQT